MSSQKVGKISTSSLRQFSLHDTVLPKHRFLSKNRLTSALSPPCWCFISYLSTLDRDLVAIAALL